MPSASAVPPTSAAQPAPSTHTTMDPYSLPHASEVFVDKKRRGGAPPPLQMPQEYVQQPSQSPQGVVPSPHYMHPQMPQYGSVYHHSQMAHPQAYVPHSPQYAHYANAPSQPMTPITPMVMTPMSGPHPGGFQACPPPPPHAHHVPTYTTGVASPMTPMTPMSYVSEGGNSHHVQYPQYPSAQGMYGVPQPTHHMYEVSEGHHSPVSMMSHSPTSGANTPTYSMYPNTYEMGYAHPQVMPHGYQTVPQAGYSYDGYTVEGGVSPVSQDQEWDGMTDVSEGRRRARKNRGGKKDENQAVDAVRYKTKMCRNWEITNRCPYGPRCLFAHGRCELRTTAVNMEAITAAARSPVPETAFYENGRFPEFVPVPTELIAQLSSHSSTPVPRQLDTTPTPIEIATQQA